MSPLFGTSGIRGHAETLFTNQFAFDLGRAFANFLLKHSQVGKVAVGLDPRPSGERIKTAFILGLENEGRQVFDEGITPVPSMNWLLKASDFVGSAMITGSHIKAELNGIKFFTFGEEILKEHEKEIEEIYANLKEQVAFTETTARAAKEELAKSLYIKLLKSKLDLPYPSWRVVIDCGNGAQSETAAEALMGTALELEIINCRLQGEFMARDTEVEADFESLKKAVIEKKGDLGVGFDADGDRVVFIDKNGNFIPGDYASALLAQNEATQSLVVTVNVSQVAELLGKPVYRTKVGSPYVVEKMKETGSNYGFEANGGPIFAENMLSRDGGMAMVKMLNLMKNKKKTLGELVAQLPKYFSFKDKVDCPWELEALVLGEVEKKYQGNRFDRLDGLKVWLKPDSWILFRSSKNAPEFRVFTEAPTEEEAMKLGQDGIELVKGVIKENEGLSNRTLSA